MSNGLKLTRCLEGTEGLLAPRAKSTTPCLSILCPTYALRKYPPLGFYKLLLGEVCHSTAFHPPFPLLAFSLSPRPREMSTVSLSLVAYDLLSLFFLVWVLNTPNVLRTELFSVWPTH